jgi:DNA-binding NarL/FixJ family response regulator
MTARIVVADDHPIVRSGIVAILSDTSDLEVVGEAGDGIEAVQLAQDLFPDLILMDLRMPGLDGAEATAEIMAINSGVRVLALTTYESDDHILRAIEAGASGYLLKASPAEEIVAGVRAVLRGETVLAPAIASALVQRMRGTSARVPKLSARELEVLRLVSRGLSNPAIATTLFIGDATVKTHLQHVFEKLAVTDRTRAVTKAMELGIL